MALAQIGPLTALLESLATAVGAGMLLGSFAVGAVGLVAGWPRSAHADRALSGGYVGGILGAAFAAFELAALLL